MTDPLADAMRAEQARIYSRTCPEHRQERSVREAAEQLLADAVTLGWTNSRIMRLGYTYEAVTAARARLTCRA